MYQQCMICCRSCLGDWYSNDMLNVLYYERIDPQEGLNKTVYDSVFARSKDLMCEDED